MEILDYSLAALVTVVGFSLIFLEALIPSGVFMVLGVTLFVSGAAGLLFPPLGTPIGLLGTMLVVAPAIYLLYSRVELYGGDGTDVRGTSDASALEGERGHVTETVTPDGGRVELKNGGMNPSYMARSEEGTIEEGTEIVVVESGGGNVLIVAPDSESGATE